MTERASGVAGASWRLDESWASGDGPLAEDADLDGGAASTAALPASWQDAAPAHPSTIQTEAALPGADPDRPRASLPGAQAGAAARWDDRVEEPAPPAPSGRALDVLLLVSGWVLLALVEGGAPVPLRLVCTFAFVAFGPGLSLRRWLPADGALETFVQSIAASLSLAVLVTLVLALDHALTDVRALVILAALSSLVALADLVRTWRTARALRSEAPHLETAGP